MAAAADTDDPAVGGDGAYRLLLPSGQWSREFPASDDPQWLEVRGVAMYALADQLRRRHDRGIAAIKAAAFAIANEDAAGAAKAAAAQLPHTGNMQRVWKFKPCLKY